MSGEEYTILIDMKDKELMVDKYVRRELRCTKIIRRESAKADLKMLLTIQPCHVVALLYIHKCLKKLDENREAGSCFASVFIFLFSEPKHRNSPASFRDVHTDSSDKKVEPNSNTIVLSVEALLANDHILRGMQFYSWAIAIRT